MDDDAAPGGIGISWASAFDDLQDALAVAGVGDTIHVARGTYFPTSGVSRTATFSIPGGVTLRGGYAGVLAGNPNIRDPQAFPTILSGAIGNATDTDNSYTIVTASGLSSAVTIEGFTLTGGNANGASPFSALGRGGAVWISGVPSVAIHDCHFEGNQSNGHGGAIYVSTADLTLTDSSFTDNSSAAGSGGAMYVSFAILLVRGTSFDVNSATDGGALLCTESFCTIVNSTFNDNDAGRGGALLLTESTTELVNTTLIGNTAGTAGGAMFHENGELSLIHTTVMGNHVVSDGGLGGAGSGGDAEVMESTPTESLSKETSDSANAAAKAVGEFSKMLGTFDSSKLAGINPRRRIRLTASDFWELNLHKFFSMPENLIGDFTPVFVTFSVACQPGWRTREGFAGVVDVVVVISG
ncbi:MAG: hypothetical protein IID33_05985 [Planctomycetes bacterium]|nr:hypothetical protein [Planctomycetota bacterium]